MKRLKTRPRSLLIAVALAVIAALGSVSTANAASSASETVVPAAPSNLTAKAVSPTSVKLTWTNHATNQSGVVISRDGVKSVDVQGTTVSSYTWKGLSPGTKYWFYVASKIYGTPGDPTGNGNTQSAWVGPVYMTTPKTSATSSKQCNFVESLQTCKSTDRTVNYYDTATGDTSHCTFVFNIKWGDGRSTINTVTNPTPGNHLVAKHTYAAPRVYIITVTPQVTVGTCTATSSAHTFTLLAPPGEACVFDAPTGVTTLDGHKIFGHVGWGFMLPSGYWEFGANEGPGNLDISKTWYTTGTRKEMLKAFRDKGNHHSATFYTQYKCAAVNTTSADISQAGKTVLQEFKQFYAIPGHDCESQVYNVLTAYGVKHLPSDTSRFYWPSPNNWFNHLSSAGFGKATRL